MDSLGIEVRLVPAQSELFRAPHPSVECDLKLVEESLGIFRVDHPSQILFFLFRKKPDTASGGVSFSEPDFFECCTDLHRSADPSPCCLFCHSLRVSRA